MNVWIRDSILICDSILIRVNVWIGVNGMVWESVWRDVCLGRGERRDTSECLVGMDIWIGVNIWIGINVRQGVSVWIWKECLDRDECL